MGYRLPDTFDESPIADVENLFGARSSEICECHKIERISSGIHKMIKCPNLLKELADLLCQGLCIRDIQNVPLDAVASNSF